MLAIFLKGMLIGLSIAAPVGPMGVLCIQRSLSGGVAGGMAVGLGVAIADAIYGAVAGFGLTMISGFLLANKAWFSVAGGCILLWMGLKTLRQPTQMPATTTASARVRNGSLAGDFSASFILGLTNPATIVFFMAVFTAFGAEGLTFDNRGAVTLVAGVFLGSTGWWALLSTAATRMSVKLTDRLPLVTRISGCVIAAFGLGAFATLFL